MPEILRLVEWISIHTTVSVVTPNTIFFLVMEKFQSTPLYQWWLDRVSELVTWKHFNPHHCISGDELAWAIQKRYKISIHTTVSVVTNGVVDLLEGAIFQSTPLYQWWHLYIAAELRDNQFQSTPLYQWWQNSRMKMPQKWLFQSTPLYQWWQMVSEDLADDLIFQSTPLYQWWRAPWLSLWRWFYISIHTTVSVVTTEIARHAWDIAFQSTPLYQWWQGIWARSWIRYLFQSTPLYQWWQHKKA